MVPKQQNQWFETSCWTPIIEAVAQTGTVAEEASGKTLRTIPRP